MKQNFPNISIVITFLLLDFVSQTKASLNLTYITEDSDNQDTIYEDDSLLVIISSEQSGVVNCVTTYQGIVKLEKEGATNSGSQYETEFKVTGIRLGEEWLECSQEPPSTPDDNEIRVPIVVIRRQSLVDKIFPFYVTIMVLMLNVVFGTEVTIRDIRFILLRPKPLIAAAICQFILLPPFGLVIARVFAYEPDVALGLLMVACAPGGGNSNTASYLVGGEVPLSIAMTFFSTAIAIGAMPLNLWAYGRYASNDPNFSPETIPYLKLARTLILIVIPVAIGMVLISKANKITTKVMRFARPVVFVLFLTFIATAIYRSLFAFQLMPFKGFMGALLLPVGGFTLGAIGAACMGLRVSQIKTIALEVGMQNAGIVISMTLVVFSQPKADLNSIMPICIALMTAVISTPFYVIHYLVYKYNKSYRAVCDGNKEAQLMEREMFEKNVMKSSFENEDDDEEMCQKSETEEKTIEAQF